MELTFELLKRPLRETSEFVQLTLTTWATFDVFKASCSTPISPTSIAGSVTPWGAREEDWVDLSDQLALPSWRSVREFLVGGHGVLRTVSPYSSQIQSSAAR